MTVPDLKVVVPPSTGDEDAVTSFVAVYEKATADEAAARAYREAGTVTIVPPRGKHHRKAIREAKPERPKREPLLRRLGLTAGEPLTFDGDIDIRSEDTGEWLAAMQHGGTGARRKLTQEFARRGWLRRPRKARSLAKRHRKAAMEIAA